MDNIRFWCNMYYIVGAIIYICEYQENRVSRQPMVFSFLLAAAWLGLSIGMTYEIAIVPAELLAAPYDNQGKALIGLCYAQG